MVWRNALRNLFPRPGWFCFGGGSDEADPGLFEVFLEAGAAVAFVRHDGLAFAAYPGVGQHGGADVAFVGFGAGESEGDRQPRRCCNQMETQSPEVAGECDAQ